jgi:putative pyruvate formate lyase activating enzyme
MGVCGQTAQIKAARAALHMWEEPCISGNNGSGTVFFSGCALHCVYCQNQNIANASAGKVISTERLAEIFLELQAQNANNINLVTPSQFVPQIIRAIDLAWAKGLFLPIVYNTSSYETVETIRMLEGYVDVYLPDLKYKDPVRSEKYSHAPDYFLTASNAIAEMVRQTGEPQFVPEEWVATKGRWKDTTKLNTAEYQEYSKQHDGDGIMVRGTIVRHLLLPGGSDDSKEVIKYLIDTYGTSVFVSLMSQYTPLPQVQAYPELGRTVTKNEYEKLIDYAISIGLENGFIQEGKAAKESFVPEFDNQGI